MVCSRRDRARDPECATTWPEGGTPESSG